MIVFWFSKANQIIQRKFLWYSFINGLLDFIAIISIIITVITIYRIYFLLRILMLNNYIKMNNKIK